MNEAFKDWAAARMSGIPHHVDGVKMTKEFLEERIDKSIVRDILYHGWMARFIPIITSAFVFAFLGFFIFVAFISASFWPILCAWIAFMLAIASVVFARTGNRSLEHWRTAKKLLHKELD